MSAGASSTSSNTTASHSPPKSLLLPPINFPILNKRTSNELASTSSFSTMIKQPGHHISPEFILSGSSPSTISSASTNKSEGLQLTPSPSSPSSAMFHFEPFKLSAESSPYIPSFMNSPNFYHTLLESKPPGLVASTQLSSSSETSTPAIPPVVSLNQEKNKQNPESSDSFDAPGQPKGQITILKRLASSSSSSSSSSSATAIASSNEEASLGISKSATIKIGPTHSSGNDQNSSQTKTTSTKLLQSKPSLEASSLPKPILESFFASKQSIEPQPISRSELEAEITKSICSSIEKNLFPRIEASIKSLIDDVAKFQPRLITFHLDNEAIDNLTQKMHSNIASSTKNLEKSISAIESNLMNIVLSAESEARNATQSGVTSKLLAEGKYAQALRDALLRNDSHQILSILSQIPYKKPKALEGLSLPETFKLITIFKDVVEEGANAPFFAVSLFWLYETLVRFECFVGSISPCRSPSSSANNIMSIANNDESIKTIRTEAKRILQELSRDSGFEDGLIVALFESFSIYYQRNVLSNIPSIVGGSTQQEDSALSERKLRLTNRLILSLQVELDKLLNDDY